MSDHKDVGITLGGLGNAYGSIGDYQRQKELLGRALVINEKHYGPDHKEVASTLSNLGNPYGSIGNYHRQKELLERALAINEKHYGPDHKEVAITLGFLGNAYGSIGDYQRQMELLGRALLIPVAPDMITHNARLGSFEGWPEECSQRPRELVEAGFYFTGTSDIVKCFQCGGVLARWLPNDDVWVEHAR